MISITIASENCNTWQKKNHEDTAAYELECSSCSAYGSFSYLQKYFIWCWEINIPFIYGSSALTWQAIPDKFCDGADKIAHSTLFKAVHGLGKSILRDNKIKKALSELVSH